MSQSPSALDEDRLRRLASELVTVIRREVPSYDDTQDLGVTLVGLLAFLADALTWYEERIADEGYLATAGRSRIGVTVGGLPWREVASLDGAGPDDAVYVVVQQDPGSATVRLGDGRHGRRPAIGARLGATYVQGSGASHAAVSVRWPPEPPLAFEVHADAGHVRFAPSRRSWLACLARRLGVGGRHAPV